jgi:hypothetical protein
MAFTVDPNFDHLILGMNVFSRHAESQAMDLLRSRQLDAYIKSSDSETAAYGLGYIALLKLIQAKIAGSRGDLVAARIFFQRALSDASMGRFTASQTSEHVVRNCQLDVGILEYLAGNLGQAVAILTDLSERVLPRASFYLGRMFIEAGQVQQGLAILAQTDLDLSPSYFLIRKEIEDTLRRGGMLDRAVVITQFDLCQFPY